MVRSSSSTRTVTSVPRVGTKESPGSQRKGEEGRCLEGTTDGGEHREAIPTTGEVLVDVQHEAAAVRSGEGDVELQAAVADLEACCLEHRMGDAEQPLAEALVAGGVDLQPRLRVELDVPVVPVGQQDDPAAARASRTYGSNPR
jgi:hypothetical protein